MWLIALVMFYGALLAGGAYASETLAVYFGFPPGTGLVALAVIAVVALGLGITQVKRVREIMEHIS